MKQTHALRAFLLGSAAAFLAASAPSAHAATYTWANSNVPGTNTSQTLDWFTPGPNTQGTWTGGTPVINDNTTTIQFFTTATAVGSTVNPSNPTHTSNINNGGSAFVLGTLNLGGKGQGVFGANQTMVISGDALNFSAATGTINLDTTLTASRSIITWNVNSNIQLGTASSASALTLTGNGNAVFNIGGNISELQSGGGSLIKSGSSTVRLTGTNTYTGGTTISAGTLQLGNGGTTGSLSTSSAIVNNGTFAINRTNTVTQGTDFSGLAITGTGGFTQAGTGGTTTLNAANSYSGLTMVSAGTLVLNGSNSSAGNTQVGTGSTATLSLGKGTNNGLASGTIIFNNGFIQSSDANARTVSNAISVGSSTVPSIAVNGTGNIFFTDTSTVGLSSAAGKTVNFVISNPTTTFAQSFADGSVNGNLIKNGLGTLVLTGNSSYTGETTILQGTVTINTIKDYGQSSALGASTSGLSIRFGETNKSGTLLYTGGVQSTNRTIQIGNNSATPSSGDFGSATIQNDGSGALTFSAATFNTQTNAATGAGANRTLTLQGSNNGTISGIIQNNLVSGSATGTATVGVTKSGTGTWTLSGSNTFTGTTTLNAGTLNLDYSSNDNSKLANTTGILALNGGTLELSGGSHVEAVTSTTLNTGGTFVKRTSGTSQLAMGAITFTAGAIDFGANNIATTTSTVSNGILSQRATVAGANFAMKSGSDIVAYDYATSGVTGYTGAAMVANTNYSLTANGASTLASTTGATSNTLKIANTASGSLAVNALTLTTGAILFTGSANYDITTSGAGKITTTLLHNYGTGGAVLNLGALGGPLVQYGTGKTVLTSTAQVNAGVTVNGGSVQFSTNAQLGTPSNGAALVLNNGTLLANTAGGNITLDNAGANKRNVTLNTGGGTLDVIGGNKLTVSGVISGTGNPLTIGNASTSGTVELTGTNTYTGATTVSGGTLLVNGSISTSITTVQSGATLGGAGTLGAVTVNSGAFHTPGNSPGIQSITGNYANAGTLGIEINGATVGTQYDQVNTTGTVSLSGLLSVTMGGSYNPAENALFFILANDGTGAITGTFSNAATDGGTYTFGGQQFQISYFGNQTSPGVGTFTGGNDVVLRAVAIPEPNIAALLGGFGMLALLRRRR